MAEFEPSVRPDEVEIAAEQLDVIFETSLRPGLTNRSATRCCLPAQSAHGCRPRLVRRRTGISPNQTERTAGAGSALQGSGGWLAAV